MVYTMKEVLDNFGVESPVRRAIEMYCMVDSEDEQVRCFEKRDYAYRFEVVNKPDRKFSMWRKYPSWKDWRPEVG